MNLGFCAHTGQTGSRIYRVPTRGVRTSSPRRRRRSQRRRCLLLCSMLLFCVQSRSAIREWFLFIIDASHTDTAVKRQKAVTAHLKSDHYHRLHLQGRIIYPHLSTHAIQSGSSLSTDITFLENPLYGNELILYLAPNVVGNY